MLPLELKIKGFYSYQEEQIIDFDALTQAGLFGIFGNVGSGKSSILEAIGFVLYSETERLHSRDGRAYNMLNLKSNEAIIDFTFLNFEERKFKFTARWTRNKNNFEDAGTIKRLAYEWIDGKWIPLESANAETVIGLSYENFRRTIIIPQGQFKEFLELKGKERSEMMKAIFNLQQFDLGGKVSFLQSENKSKQTELEGKLSIYESVSAEIIEEKQSDLTIVASKLTLEQKELASLETQVEILKGLKNKFEQLDLFNVKITELKARKPAIDALSANVILFEKTEKSFKSGFQKSKELAQSFSNLKSELENLEEKKFKLTDEIKILNDEILVLQPKFDQLEQSKKYISELDTILKIKVLDETISTLSSSTQNDAKNIVWLDEQLKILEIAIQNISKELQNLKAQKMDTKLLMSIDNWYSTAKNQKEISATLTSEIELLEINLNTENKRYASYNVTSESWKSELKSAKDTLEISLQKALKEEQSLLISNEMAKYSAQLHDGKPCPLCGSENHPNIMEIDDVSEKLDLCRNLISELQANLISLTEKEKELGKIDLKVNFLQTDKEAKETALAQRKSEFLEHSKLFVWSEFQPEDSSIFDAKKESNQKIEQEIELLEVEMLKNQHQFEHKKKQKETLVLKISGIENQIAENNGALNNEKGKLALLKFEDFLNIDKEIIAKERDLKTEENRITKLNFETKTAVLIEKNQSLAANSALISTKTVDFDSVVIQQSELEVLFDKLLKENNFSTLEEVRVILNQQIDVEKERQVIEHFLINYQTTNNQLIALETELEGKNFDQDLFAATSTLFLEKRAIVGQLIGENQSKIDQLEILKKQLKEKELLLVNYDFITKRAQNLSILNGLFQANGFVNYVSTIYLQNLCDVANIRFHRMTKNHLSLVINDKNEFDVIDYLNNGSKRSVKTLSGGQLFQASLCLALALAESVQSLSKGDKNFFFIDEGFGTQDQESIAIVFETLQTLYKENRIVGIISHVAEMKESIPRSITVEKDAERGSLIKASWD